MYYTWKNMKRSFYTRYSRLFCVKKHGEQTDNPSIRIYVNKIENRIMFKIKTGYYLQFLTPETIELLGGSKSRITKDENGECASFRNY